MLISTVRRIVDFCSERPWPILGGAVVLTLLSAGYAANNFAITTDVNKLISPELDWRKREIAFEAAFPGPYTSILVVVDAPTPELATRATGLLAQKLSAHAALSPSVRQLDGGPFFEKNGLLFQSAAEVTETTAGLTRASQLITTLANDQSLRGLTRALSFGLLGVQYGQAKLEDLQSALTMASDTIEQAQAAKPATFSWHAMMRAKPPETRELRHFIEVRPVLDYAALEPGRAASDAIRQAATDLKLASDYQARVRLTGPVAMADDEFGTLQEGAVVNTVATILVVLLILWLALRSGRIIAAVFVNLFVGLAITAAVGLMMVGALNLISIAFAVLFVGLGVDFGIQFAVRYRAERHEVSQLRPALVGTAQKIGAPLTLAAAAVAAGFLSFWPTDYQGVSELGKIAGVGMLIAYATSITVLPALLTLLSPQGEPEEVGYRALAPVDRFLERHRIPVIAGTGLLAVAGLPLLYYLTFDFNPVNLRSPHVESVATFLDLRSDPNVGASSIDVIVPNVAAVPKAAEQLRTIPEVGRVMTIHDFVPSDQDSKLAAIQALARRVGPALQSEGASSSPPTDAQNVAALRTSAEALNRAAAGKTGSGADAAKRLAVNVAKLADADQPMRAKVEAAFVGPLQTVLHELRDYLRAEPIALETLPGDQTGQWIAADGKARIVVQPKGDPNDNETLRSFARAVLAQFPEAVGSPIAILKSGEVVVSAFFQAGIFALVSITILLWIVLRRFGDVLLTLLPLLLAGVLTLEICVLIGMPLNFANIIALPLLLGVGVAFKIYYIMAWRAGQTDLLQSSLTRAVIWSALTTATAFGSLWLSSHSGTSSMGKLLALSLLTTMAAAVLFQPALMGKPREISDPTR